ncbi:ATPase, T2SS/T4P/T4SS family [Senimuribacter intestinalis]|uniref:ATPase, T2SS/T4P/T4SS family n=1 Tax=Senimuribacter intestinalis TaxID=2941507 RepID=UPI00203A5BF8|nr:ATPase, T2SS/T4P/T4SS family [Senimuribacter intestinalis]
MEKAFSLEAYLSKVLHKEESAEIEPLARFRQICSIVEAEFDKEWDETDDMAKNRKLEREKRAMMGFSAETAFYKEKIKEILREKKLTDSWYPPWYPDLAEGIFAETYGLSGLAPWAYDMDEKYRQSSSAKLIGDRLYCLIDGKSQLQPQRIPGRRREQLKRTLLLATPYERLEYGFHEVYLNNGIRITIYSGDRTKEGQDIMVFRKYILPELSFEHLAKIGTIPKAAISLFYKMIEIGFNVLFSGQVRSGKTTFMQVWQKYEDPNLEGLAIATDPETPWHEIMPKAPIMQLVADGERLSSITKSLLRGDNDYILLEEMRDGPAFYLALDITSTGTTRSKGTIHDNDAVNVPYKMASKICQSYGGDMREVIAQVYKNFDYVLELSQVPEDKSKKVLKGIWQYSYDVKQDKVAAKKLCSYDFFEKVWRWNPNPCLEKAEKYPQLAKEIKEMNLLLAQLAANMPMAESEAETLFPAYYQTEGGTCG